MGGGGAVYKYTKQTLIVNQYIDLIPTVWKNRITPLFNTMIIMINKPLQSKNVVQYRDTTPSSINHESLI